MRNYILEVSDSPRWSSPITVTLKEILRYALMGAMGIWDVERAFANVSNSSTNTDHTRWYWDTYDGSIELRSGFFDNKGDDTYENSELFFKFYNVRSKLRIGDYGRGDFHYGGKSPSNNIGWKVIKITYS